MPKRPKPKPRPKPRPCILPFLAALAVWGCGPLVTDSRSNPAAWAIAGARVEKASGIVLSKLVAPCSGPGCAHDVKDLGRGVLGKGSWSRFQARAKKNMSDATEKHVKVHELLHTLLVRHVTTHTVMHPYVGVGEDVICMPELLQLCEVFPGRCRWKRPEPRCPGVTATEGVSFKIEVPDANGESKWVPWNVMEERIRRGQQFYDAAMDLADLVGVDLSVVE